MSTRWRSPSDSCQILARGSTAIWYRAAISSISASTVRAENPMPPWRDQPSTTFSATVRLSTRLRCWWTMKIPAACASWGECSRTGLPLMLDLALVRPVQPGQDVAEGGLPRAVLAEQRVHFAVSAPRTRRGRWRPRHPRSAW